MKNKFYWVFAGASFIVYFTLAAILIIVIENLMSPEVSSDIATSLKRLNTISLNSKSLQIISQGYASEIAKGLAAIQLLHDIEKYLIFVFIFLYLISLFTLLVYAKSRDSSFSAVIANTRQEKNAFAENRL